MPSRPRFFAVIPGLMWAVLTANVVADELKSPFEDETPQMIQLRRTAKQRVRRIIYNDDGCGPIWHDKAGSLTAERFLYGPESRASAVLGTQVDSMFLSSGATHVLMHPSRVAESYADTEERYGPFGGGFDHFRNNFRALEDLGTDALKLTVDFCQQNRVEIFYSYRVNDLHLAQGGDVSVERSTWWRTHPEYRLGSAEDELNAAKYPATDPRCWGWASINFELPEVRTYLLSILEDVIDRYNLDGLEIDYLRAPIFFSSSLELKPATAHQLQILTDFQREVRLIAVRAGKKRCRPLLVAARVPTTIGRCQYVGIDIEQWLELDLLDVMPVGGGYVTFTTPAAEMVELGHKYRVPVYPVISASGMRDRYTGIEAWRGSASNVWSTGADGVYLFNHSPNKPSPQFRELGDSKSLATLDKIFAVENDPAGYWGHYFCVVDSSAAFGDPNRYGAEIGVMPKSRLLPLAIDRANDWLPVFLPIGDNLPVAASSKTLKSAILKVRLNQPQEGLEVKLNDQLITCTEKDAEGRWLSFNVDPSRYKLGENNVSFRIAEAGATDTPRLEILAVEVHVNYMK